MAVRQMGNSTEKLVEAGFLLGFLAWGGNIFGWVGANWNKATTLELQAGDDVGS